MATMAMLLSVVGSSSTMSYLAWRCSSYNCGRRRLDLPDRRYSSFERRNCPSFCLKLLL